LSDRKENWINNLRSNIYDLRSFGENLMKTGPADPERGLIGLQGITKNKKK